MNTHSSRIATRRPSIRGWSQALLPTLLMAGGLAHAELRLEIPGDVPGLPCYLRMQQLEVNPQAAPSDGIWSALIVYRQRECTPDDYNLLQGLDFPNAFGCPLNPGFSGFEIWTNPPGVDMGPQHYRLVAEEPVPVLFVRSDELLEAAADGVLTITDIEALPSLRIGLAETYSEIGRPSMTPFIHITAAGTFEDGDRFALTYSLTASPALGQDGPPVNRTEIRYPGAASSARPPRPFPFAGHWFNPESPGQGMELAFPRAEQRVVGNWFGQDGSGAAVWYALDSAVGPELSLSDSIGFDGMRATLSVMAASPGDASGPSLAPVAALTLEFISCLRAEARFHDIAAGVELPTEPFAITNLVPVDDCRD